MTPFRPPELLAPAGDSAALAAALAAGANAVYFGLGELNARRRARNFTADELANVVGQTHAVGAKAYLTLNIDLKDRELGTAARLLALAATTGVDAVLVRDPALLALRPFFPTLPFHFSTQAGATSSMDARAARELGLTRVVLARECSLAEIQAAGATGIEIEVFVQGALCYCISGRCLLSSWGGGRGGNRGACTSPCRVPWGVGEPAGTATPLSMQDLGLADRLRELANAGAYCLKIEGRMKNAAWVAQATALYREALDSDGRQPFQHRAAVLGDYTGRPITDGYLDGRRERLTGTWARAAGADSEMDAEGVANGQAVISSQEPTPPKRTYDLQIMTDPKGIRCSCTFRGEVREWVLPLAEPRRADRAISIREYLESLKSEPIQGHTLARCRSDLSSNLLMPRLAKEISAEVSKTLHLALKKMPAAPQKLPLPDAVREALAKPVPHPDNKLPLGGLPNRVRLAAGQVGAFAAAVPVVPIVAELATPELLPKLAGIGQKRLAVALPAIFFEADIPGIERLVQLSATLGLTVEVNNWGGWEIARRHPGLRLEAGPGLAVFNVQAARFLGSIGFSAIHWTVEADQSMLEDLSAACPLPATLIVYGRPVLMLSRAEQPAETLGKIWEDRRDIRMIPHHENGLLAFRSATPFSLLGERNERIRAAWLAADLVAATDPATEWNRLKRPNPEPPFTFNYHRGLA